MSTTYSHLLSSIRVGAHTLRNRVVMGSMHTRLETLDRPLERLISFYVARARGGAALLVTAGHSPNRDGRLEEDAQVLDSPSQVPFHAALTSAVHAHGAKIVLQILHAGRYAKHAELVAPSAIASPINRRTPRALSYADVERTIEDFVRTAELARDAGYDGVEIMGSEGYLLTQFAAHRSNVRTDRWGGSLENRCRLAIEIVARTRARLGPSFLISYRISAIDLVDDGLTGDEIDWLAREIERAGADMLVTGIGWHESPVPTIANPVPRAAWAFAAARLKTAVRIPVVATNRINTPEVAESLLADGRADLVALARPLLADPDFVAKAAAGRRAEIAPCIACNQSCLDHIFADATASCLVNPLAGREVEFDAAPSRESRRIAVIGAGPAGLACSIRAAERGHRVTLYEASGAVGGQLQLAARIPGKEEFHGLLRWFEAELARVGVDVRLDTRIDAESLARERFDRVVVATGSLARHPDLDGLAHPKIAGYREVIDGTRAVGARVAIIGTGGIAHDVAEVLVHADGPSFLDEWGVDARNGSSGGLQRARTPSAARTVTLFQRGTGRPGARLGVSTGWIVRARLKARGVSAVTNCRYVRVDDAGLHYTVDGVARVAEVDAVVICAGQEPDTTLAMELGGAGIGCDVIGGARLATELDAARAIREGTRLASEL